MYVDWSELVVPSCFMYLKMSTSYSGIFSTTKPQFWTICSNAYVKAYTIY